MKMISATVFLTVFMCMAIQEGHSYNVDNFYLASAQWRCKRCKQYIWVEDPDWRGDYYCPGCGTRIGEE